MAFEKKTWYNDGVVPDDAPEGTVAPYLDADNMNRIEGGITEAFSKITEVEKEAFSKITEVKKYVDESVLLFTGNVDVGFNTSINLSFGLPTDLNLSKYIGVLMVPSARDGGGDHAPSVVLLAPNVSVEFTRFDTFRSASVKINTDSNTLQFSGNTSSSLDFRTSFQLLLIPCLNKGVITAV